MVGALDQNSPVTETVSDLFVFHGYTAARGIGVGKYVASDVFTVGGYKFAIHFYPDGDGEDTSTHVSTHLKLLSEGADDLQPLLELTIMDQSGRGKHLSRSSCYHAYAHEPGSGMWGYRRFFTRTNLETSVYLQDDCLKIFYTVGVAALADDRSKLFSIQAPERAPKLAKTCSVTEMTSGSNLFVIQGYSTAKGFGVGNRIVSNEFTVGGYKWAIHFYPDGKFLDENSSHGSLFVALASEGRNVRALFELTLMDQSGKAKHKVRSCFMKSLTDKLHKGGEWGYKRFFKRTNLQMTDYLRDDCLKIYCTVGVVSAIDYSRLRSIPVPDSDIGSHIGMLLENMKGCDIAFNVSGEKLCAHKLILAVRSPKLWSEYVEGSNTEEVMVPDIEADVFKVLLHFIYKDALAKNELIPSALQIADTLTAKLMAAANRFDLGRLKRLCESRMCKYITINSVTQVLVLADCNHAAELKDVCLKFAAKNLAAVMDADGYKCFGENYPSLMQELLNTAGGPNEDRSNGGGNSEGVLPQLSDGNDDSHRRVKQRV